MRERITRVFGPAYLDEVHRVDAPLLDLGVIDSSFDGRKVGGRGDRLTIVDDRGCSLVVEGASPGGTVGIEGHLDARGGVWTRTVREVEARDDLGGMGAGFAHALGGELVSALGPEGDPISDRVSRALADRGISHRPIRVPGVEGDVTLILSSGARGDKLAIGFRGCHSAVDSLPKRWRDGPCDIVVAAGFSNRVIAEVATVPACLRLLTPAIRNIREKNPPLAAIAGAFHVWSCNRIEWEALDGRDAVLRDVPLVAITDGPDGCRLAFRDLSGEPHDLRLPIFPLDRPILDTNRAGEAFAATLVETLFEVGWSFGPSDPDLIRRAGLRASAASALVLRRDDFGFPSPAEIDAALARAG